MSGKHSETSSIDRRRFLQRVGLVGVFAVPAITTLSMSSVGDAFGSPSKSGGSANSIGDFGCFGNQTSGPGSSHVQQGLNEVCRDLERISRRGPK